MLFGDEEDEELSLGKTADIVLEEEDKGRSGAAGNDPQEGVSSRLTNDLLLPQDVVDLDYIDEFSDIDDDTLVDGGEGNRPDTQVLAAESEKPQKEQHEKPHVSLFYCWGAKKLYPLLWDFFHFHTTKSH